MPAGSRTQVWLARAHALALTYVPCQPTSKLAQAAGMQGGEVVVKCMHDSLKTILSLSCYLASL